MVRKRKGAENVTVSGKLNVAEGEEPLLKLLLMRLPDMRLQLQDAMLKAAFQEPLCNVVALVHPVGSVYPTTAPKFDGELSVDERGLLEHKLLD